MIPTWTLQIDTIERWAYVENLFSPTECDAIIQYGKSVPLIQGGVDGEQLQDNFTEYRNSNIRFIGPTNEMVWVYKKFTDAVNELNSKYFKFDLTAFNEGLQFTEYVAPNGKYDYHIDKTYKKIARKLSLVLLLSDNSSYTGGDFEILDGADPEALPKKQGTLLVFPSWTMHRVTPITSGTRYSLVGWVGGPQFK
jgi:PKHD-type hydroxylase